MASNNVIIVVFLMVLVLLSLLSVMNVNKRTMTKEHYYNFFQDLFGKKTPPPTEQPVKVVPPDTPLFMLASSPAAAASSQFQGNPKIRAQIDALKNKVLTQYPNDTTFGQAINTQQLTANNASLGNVTVNGDTTLLNAKVNGLRVADKPLKLNYSPAGALFSRQMSIKEDDVFGFGNSEDNTVRMYTSSDPNAKAALSFKNRDGSFDDAFVAKKNGSRFILKGDGDLVVDSIKLGQKFHIVNSGNDDWLRLTDGKGLDNYFGGLAMKDLWVQGTSTVGGDLTVYGDIQTNNIKSTGNASFDRLNSKNKICINNTCADEQTWKYIRERQPGPKGLQGPKGTKGASPPGLQGIQGLKGLQGPKGPQGPEGIIGGRGLQGYTGDRGPKGDKGDKGDRGIVGYATKVVGPQGAAGTPGKPGAAGDAGSTGTPGSDGANGTSIESVTSKKTNDKTNITVTFTDTSKPPVVFAINDIVGRLISNVEIKGNLLVVSYNTGQTQTFSIPMPVKAEPGAVAMGPPGPPGPPGQTGAAGDPGDNAPPSGPPGKRGETGPEGSPGSPGSTFIWDNRFCLNTTCLVESDIDNLIRFTA